MLRLPKLTDYAVVVLGALAQEAGRVVTMPELASRAGLPEPTVAKILKKLGKCGILAAQRGTRGGYRLLRDPAAITVADIVVALDGPVALTECAGDRHGQCGMESRCAMRGQWNAINRAIAGVLAGVSLADMQRGPDMEARAGQ